MQQLFWDGEPTEIASLLETYQVEAKIPGRLAGTTLYVMDVKNRVSNKSENIVEDQTFKLFLVPRPNGSLMIQIQSDQSQYHVTMWFLISFNLEFFAVKFCYVQAAHMDVELPTDQFLIGHGASRFKAADKVADIKRKKQLGWPG